MLMAIPYGFHSWSCIQCFKRFVSWFCSFLVRIFRQMILIDVTDIVIIKNFRMARRLLSAGSELHSTDMHFTLAANTVLSVTENTDHPWGRVGILDVRVMFSRMIKGANRLERCTRQEEKTKEN
eukprot:g43480.t1